MLLVAEFENVFVSTDCAYGGCQVLFRFFLHMEILKKVPDNHPTIKLLMGMKILRPVRQVAVQDLLDWECEKESVNSQERDFLFFLPSPCVSETHREKRESLEYWKCCGESNAKGYKCI